MCPNWIASFRSEGYGSRWQSELYLIPVQETAFDHLAMQVSSSQTAYYPNILYGCKAPAPASKNPGSGASTVSTTRELRTSEILETVALTMIDVGQFDFPANQHSPLMTTEPMGDAQSSNTPSSKRKASGRDELLPYRGLNDKTAKVRTCDVFLKAL